jgi:hypothetical protein
MKRNESNEEGEEKKEETIEDGSMKSIKCK